MSTLQKQLRMRGKLANREVKRAKEKPYYSRYRSLTLWCSILMAFYGLLTPDSRSTTMTISADTWQARDHISLHHLTIWNSHVIIASLIITGHTLCVLRLIWNWELQQRAIWNKTTPVTMQTERDSICQVTHQRTSTYSSVDSTRSHCNNI